MINPDYYKSTAERVLNERHGDKGITFKRMSDAERHRDEHPGSVIYPIIDSDDRGRKSIKYYLVCKTYEPIRQ